MESVSHCHVTIKPEIPVLQTNKSKCSISTQGQQGSTVRRCAQLGGSVDLSQVGSRWLGLGLLSWSGSAPHVPRPLTSGLTKAQVAYRSDKGTAGWEET